MAVAAMLCQLHKSCSCGGCCGLYNYHHHDRHSLQQRLTQHTQLLSEYEPGKLRAHRNRIVAMEYELIMEPKIRCCPFLGFLDDAHTRVGCLLHPSRHGTYDLRDCGVYDRVICQEHRCAAHDWLTENELGLLLALDMDWYCYGLVLAEPGYLKNFISAVARASGQVPHVGQLTSFQCKQALEEYITHLNYVGQQQETPRLGSTLITPEGIRPAASYYEPNIAASSRWHDALACLELPLDTEQALSLHIQFFDDCLGCYLAGLDSIALI